MMRLLITRPEPGAAATAKLARERGYKVIVDPVSRIKRLQPDLPPPEGFDAVLLTSAQATFALGPYLQLPILTVGPATKRAAERQGALKVESAGGDWEDLLDLAEEAPPGAKFLHLAGRDIAGDIEAELTEGGYGYTRVVVYQNEPSARLSSRTKAALLRGGIDAVLLFSPRSAQTWRNLVEEAGLEGTLQGLVAVCISENAAKPVEGMGWSEVRIALRRDQVSMLERLEGPDG